MDCLHKKTHIFPFLVLPNNLFLHEDNHMSTLILFILLPFNKFTLLNSLIWKICPIIQIILRTNEKTKTITTWDHEEITPNKTVTLGATRIKEIKTTKGVPIKINHTKGRTIISELTSLVLYVVSMDIILTSSSKLLITNR
jgi:hypothetical protein